MHFTKYLLKYLAACYKFFINMDISGKHLSDLSNHLLNYANFSNHLPWLMDL